MKILAIDVKVRTMDLVSLSMSKMSIFHPLLEIFEIFWLFRGCTTLFSKFLQFHDGLQASFRKGIFG